VAAETIGIALCEEGKEEEISRAPLYRAHTLWCCDGLEQWAWWTAGWRYVHLTDYLPSFIALTFHSPPHLSVRRKGAYVVLCDDA